MKKIILTFILIFLSIWLTKANDKEIDYIISPEYSWIEQYYKKNLTNDEIEEIKKIYEKLNNTRTYCITWDNYGCHSQLTKDLNDLYLNIKKYIDIKNEIKYNEYIFKNNNIKIVDWFRYKVYIDLEKKYKENKVNNNINKWLTEKQKEQIKNKIWNFNENQINALENKINTLIKQKINENQKNILIEISEIINEINNDKFINEVLNVWNSNILPSNFSDL